MITCPSLPPSPLSRLLTKGMEVIGYAWLYQFRFFNWDWRSPYTWYATAIGVDFGYYWLHRMAHGIQKNNDFNTNFFNFVFFTEISILWCAHQVHHSSEDYNLSTALRQSAFQRWYSFLFYFPLALVGIPMPALIVHIQLNLFFQFWIHTEVVKSLGPLEWVLNTASHHRVHHGEICFFILFISF